MPELILDNLELRKLYEDNRKSYERLLKHVSMILNSAIEKRNLKVHSLKCRLKEYDSFLEKVERKRYKNPLEQCTDLAGCRIVCLFQSQVKELKNLIQKEFEVVEVTDKKTSKKFDQFGYLSLHMLVRIPKNRCQFTEFNGLDNYVCEIQIRTILQEAWAEIEHYLNYKATKQEKNEELLRKIFSLAGMFEVADSTFEEINNGFKKMIETKHDTGITALSLYKFSRDYFEWYDKEWSKKEERQFFKLSNEVKTLGITSVAKIGELLDKYHSETHVYIQKNSDDRFFGPVSVIRVTLALEYGKQIDLVFGIKGYYDRITGKTT